MSLFQEILNKSIDSLSDDERQKDWAEKGFDKTVEFMREALPANGESNELDAVRTTGEYALALLEKNKSDLVGLGAHGLRSTILLASLGRIGEAANHAAAIEMSNLSWEDTISAMLSKAESGNRAKRELDRKVEVFKGVLKSIGPVAAKALLPLLIAAI